MQYAALGTSTLQVSRIALGCMSLGDSHDDNRKLLRRAAGEGINFFDTADLYQKGLNEETVGRAFKGMREKVIIATKGGNQWRADGSGWDWNPSKAYLLKAADESLRRLQTDYIDLYQLHGGTIGDRTDETIEAFETLRQQGKIRYYGLSSIRPNVIDTFVNRSAIASVMMQYSLLDRRPEETCLPLLHSHTVGVLARGSLSGGLLLGKAPRAYLDHAANAVGEMAAAVATLANATARSPAAVALGFVLHHPATTAAVVGVRTEEQLRELLDAVAHAHLSPQEWQTLRAVLPANVYDQHRSS